MGRERQMRVLWALVGWLTASVLIALLNHYCPLYNNCGVGGVVR